MAVFESQYEMPAPTSSPPSAPPSPPQPALPDYFLSIFDLAELEQIVKLSAHAAGGGRTIWRGRWRGGGADLLVNGTWVRLNFKRCARGLVLQVNAFTHDG